MWLPFDLNSFYHNSAKGLVQKFARPPSDNPEIPPTALSSDRSPTRPSGKTISSNSAGAWSKRDGINLRLDAGHRTSFGTARGEMD